MLFTFWSLWFQWSIVRFVDLFLNRQADYILNCSEQDTKTFDFLANCLEMQYKLPTYDSAHIYLYMQRRYAVQMDSIYFIVNSITNCQQIAAHITELNDYIGIHCVIWQNLLQFNAHIICLPVWISSWKMRLHVSRQFVAKFPRDKTLCVFIYITWYTTMHAYINSWKCLRKRLSSHNRQTFNVCISHMATSNRFCLEKLTRKK